jgi:hypothetical protein
MIQRGQTLASHESPDRLSQQRWDLLRAYRTARDQIYRPFLTLPVTATEKAASGIITFGSRFCSALLFNGIKEKPASRRA